MPLRSRTYRCDVAGRKLAHVSELCFEGWLKNQKIDLRGQPVETMASLRGVFEKALVEIRRVPSITQDKARDIGRGRCRLPSFLIMSCSAQRRCE